jgi:lipopolysaccharide export system permease protein
MDHSLLDKLSWNGERPVQRAGPNLFSISRSYAIWITGQISLRLLLFVFLLECLFLSEHFLDILRDFAGEIGSVADLLFLVALSAPEVQFALPVTVLVAVYLVVLKCRESRELIALAGTGFGGRQIIALAFAWGIAAQLASLLITGVVLPYSRFAFRSDLYVFRNDAIRSGGATARFYAFPGYTVFKWPGARQADKAALFIYQQREDGTDRAISVDDANVMGSSRVNALDLQFNDIVAIDLPGVSVARPLKPAPPSRADANNCEGCIKASGSIMRAENYAQTFSLEQLWRLEPRGTTAGEWTTAELLAISAAPPGALPDAAQRSELMDRLARSLMCLSAPFIALLAVAFTNRLTQPFALAFACGAVLCLDVAGLMIAQTLSGSGFTAGVAGITATFAFILGFASWQISAWQSALVKPALSKA